MIKKLIFTFLLVLTGSTGIAQEKKIPFEKYGVAEGLPEEVAWNFLQDKQGFIWIGTQNGLVKFDGYNMQVYRSNPNNPDGLHLRNLNGGILLARDGKIWVGGVSASGGLASFDPITEKFTNYRVDFNDSTKIPYQYDFVILEDIAKNIWFMSYGDNRKGFLCKIDPKTQNVSRYPFRLGLKYNDITSNFQMAESERDSTIWIRAEDKGMYRYNRAKDTFEIQFKKGDIIPGTQLTDSILGINSARKSGLIPMANTKQLFLWDPILKKVVNTFNFTSSDRTSYGGIFEDIHGNFWVSSHDNLTILNLEKGQREDFKFGKEALDFEISGSVYSIIPLSQNQKALYFQIASRDKDSNRFIYTLKYSFESQSFELYDYNFNDENNPFVNNINDKTIAIDQTGLIWVGTRPNLYKQSPKTRQISHYKHDAKDKFSLATDTINKLFEDSKQNLWIGTSNGMALKIDEGKFMNLSWYDNKTTGSNLGHIYPIFEDSFGQIWVGSANGLFKWSPTKMAFQKLPINTKNDFAGIFAIAQDAKGRIWASNWTFGIYVLDAKTGNVLETFEPSNSKTHGLTSNTISNIFLDSKQQIWLGDPRDNDFGLFRYNENENKFIGYHRMPEDSTTITSNEIYFMVEDDLNRMWVGTDGGLNLYDSENDKFRRNNDEINLPSIHVYNKGVDGKMWFVAYSGGGLAHVGPGVNDVMMYGEDKGLLHNDADGVVFDNVGKLWLTTERGLSVFDTLTKTYTSFFEKDGFQKYGRNYNILKTQNGDIWIGGYDGLNHIVPSELFKKDTTLPKVIITSMGVNDSIYSTPDGTLFKKAVPYTQQVKLNYWQKDLSFQFVALHYLRPEDNLYSWKLENYDKAWSPASKDRQVSYTNLSPGRYTFHVKASNADGVWNETGAAIEIIIAPPWWMTWWAYSIYLLILIFLAWQFHKFQKAKTIRTEREKAQEKELAQAKEIEKAYSELKSTQAQLIQSEKMASLGELTAGIAHEIQNPLNFVNNFAEVSAELIDEVEEERQKKQEERDEELVTDIMVDLKENLKKINHHGKRAGDIVKGMLQHSRNSSGVKEPTDINALADEYLRLAYHGLRARDKSFNADFSTDFDPDLPKVNVVPQDIGRVLLNLINNAFQAVKAVENPKVVVATKHTDNTVEITVSDNGPGIPNDIKNKIFQPFFTTKPTGSGTGLGLSLSYDIAKAHGGEIKVVTKENKRTEFIIQLPI